jgi:hypothetical protein
MSDATKKTLAIKYNKNSKKKDINKLASNFLDKFKLPDGTIDKDIKAKLGIFGNIGNDNPKYAIATLATQLDKLLSAALVAKVINNQQATKIKSNFDALTKANGMLPEFMDKLGQTLLELSTHQEQTNEAGAPALFKHPIFDEKKLDAHDKPNVKVEEEKVPHARKKAFAEGFLESYGFKETHFHKDGLIKAKLGLFAPKPDDEDYVDPKATKVETTEEQTFKHLLDVVISIKKVMETRDQLIESNQKTKDEKEKEYTLEHSHDALSKITSSLTNDMQPFITALESLKENIDTLATAIKDKDMSGGGGGSLVDDALGYAAVKKLRGNKVSSVKEGLTSKQRKKLTKAGYKVSEDGSKVHRPTKAGVIGREFASAEEIEKVGNATRLGRMGEKVAGVGSSISSLVTSKVASSKIATAIGKKMAVASAAKVATRATIEKLAGPLIVKSLGKTVLKSIPIVGALAGIGFAVGRIMDGDYVGAGLDAASGLGGPITAIPALVLSIARDIYTGVYGTKPEEDALAGDRIGAITTVVKEMVTRQISPQVQVKKPSPTNNQPPKAPPIQQGKPDAKPPVASIDIPPAPKPQPPTKPADNGGGNNGGVGSNPPPKQHSEANATPTAKSPAKVESKSPSEEIKPNASKLDSTPIADGAKTSSKLLGKPDATSQLKGPADLIKPVAITETGATIKNKTEEIKQAEDNMINSGETNQASVHHPSQSQAQHKPTTSGNGNSGFVPDPTYNIGTVADQIFFGAHA